MREHTDGPLPPANASCIEEQVDLSFHLGSRPHTPLLSDNQADAGSDQSFGYFEIHERQHIHESPSLPPDGFGMVDTDTSTHASA